MRIAIFRFLDEGISDTEATERFGLLRTTLGAITTYANDNVRL